MEPAPPSWEPPLETRRRKKSGVRPPPPPPLKSFEHRFIQNEMGGNLAVASLSFPVRESFFCKKVCKKGDGGEKRAVAVVKKCSQSFSLSLSLSRSLCKYSKNGLFRMFVHGKREKKYKDVVFGRMAEYTFQGFFASRDEKNLPCCSFSHISWAVFVYSQKEKNPPSMLCRVGGNRLFASPSPSPKLSLANIFCGPPPTDPKKGWNATSERGRGKKREKTAKEEKRTLATSPRLSHRGGGRKEKENHKWHFLATAFLRGGTLLVVGRSLRRLFFFPLFFFLLLLRRRVPLICQDTPLFPEGGTPLVFYASRRRRRRRRRRRPIKIPAVTRSEPFSAPPLFFGTAAHLGHNNTFIAFSQSRKYSLLRSMPSTAED